MGVALSAHDIAAQLSLREFIKVCQFFDLRKATGQTKVVCGAGVQDVAPQVTATRFDIYDIRREADHVYIHCGDGNSTFLLKAESSSKVITFVPEKEAA